MFRRKVWSKDEEEKLVSLYKSTDLKTLSEMFGVTQQAIKCKANKLQVTKSPEYDAPGIICDYTSGLELTALISKHQIPVTCLYRLLTTHKVPKRNNRFNPDTTEFTKDYSSLNSSDLKNKYGVSLFIIHSKAKELGLVRPVGIKGKRSELSVEQEAEILEKVLTRSVEELAAEYKTTRATVRYLVAKNGYKASKQSIREKTTSTNIEKHGSPFPMRKYGAAQREVQDWLKTLGLIFNSDHKILDGKEIDLYNEELKLGIEYCGLYWHTEDSPTPRTQYYHHDKMTKCHAKGIRLITIFEDEWNNRQTQVKSFLKSVLHKNTRKFYARKCEVKDVAKSVARKFFDDYHIQGATHLGKHFAGLYFNDELLAVMSFGLHHRDYTKLVLDRLCFKDDVSVSGGSSRLFKYLVEKCKVKEIISWSDNRWSEGNVYTSLGFTLAEELKPDYSYVDFNDPYARIPKQMQKKDNTNCPENLTEKQWCNQRGLHRIWDCGKKRWNYVVTNATIETCTN